MQAALGVAQTPAPQASVEGTDAATALDARRRRMAAHFGSTLAHYTAQQIAAITVVYQAACRMLDTSGGSCCGKLLLGLYNGTRFPFDLTNLRSLDDNLYAAARIVIDMDARQTWCEVHVLLDAIYGDGRNVGAELEHWAHRLRLKGRCKREYLAADYGPKWSTAAA